MFVFFNVYYTFWFWNSVERKFPFFSRAWPWLIFAFLSLFTWFNLCIYMHLFRCCNFCFLDFIKLSAIAGLKHSNTHTHNFELLQNLATQCENWWFTRLNFLSVNEMQSKWFIICFKFDKHKRRTLIFFPLSVCIICFHQPFFFLSLRLVFVLSNSKKRTQKNKVHKKNDN